MSNINMKDIKDFCSEEREGIILKQKIKIQALEKENKLLVEKLENIDAKICGFVIDDINVDLKDFTKEELISIVENTSVKSADIIAKIRGLT